jgi:hypothetical protein
MSPVSRSALRLSCLTGFGKIGLMNTRERMAAAQRFELACEMAEAGVMMMRQKIRREHPELTSKQVDRRLQAWLLCRPGAEHGDAVGRPRRIDELGTQREDGTK